ncbi:antibiotic biosynthesis monooxygenase family protein [Consotaella aegiceratis]|uniref:antibiotic biosynthesis monooxygenase family protein n=1 Tax=Consotaella aegiceratis TaxID=3097961 RepID=UPI002F3F261F
MIKRIWHGYTSPDRADEYETLLRSEVMKEIEGKHIPGLRRFEVLRRALSDEVEFITIMEFESLDSVRAFVGEDYEQCYVPAAARAVLKRYDQRSQHYELRDARIYGQSF